MFRTLAVATVVTALACASWAPSASAAKKHAKATPPAHAETIPGVNPMTNAPAIAPVANPQPYNKVPGVNPM